MHPVRRDLRVEIGFLTMLWLESLEAMRALASGGCEAAYVPPRARCVLARVDTRAQHYEIPETSER